MLRSALRRSSSDELEQCQGYSSPARRSRYEEPAPVVPRCSIVPVKVLLKYQEKLTEFFSIQRTAT